MEDMICPKCGSSSTYKSKKFTAWVCEDCGEKFMETIATSKRWNDGFEKGKAYLLSYSSGERYRDFKLSEYLSKHVEHKANKLPVPGLSSENVFSDNLESQDIETLEELLSSKDEIIGINSLYRWVLDSIAAADKGILFLSAERGLGKSTFCVTIDQLDRIGVQKMDEALLEEWHEMESDTAIRVWHFNSDYRGRKDIFIPGLRDTVLTCVNSARTVLCRDMGSNPHIY